MLNDWRIEFGQLEGKFREEGFEKVGELVEAGVVDKDLKELGVKKLKARKTLLRALQMGAGGKVDLYGRTSL